MTQREYPIVKEVHELRAEVERLRRQYAISEGLNQAKTDQIERLRLTPEQAYLQIVEGWLRDNRGIHFPEGAVDDLCKRIARALEPKP